MCVRATVRGVARARMNAHRQRILAHLERALSERSHGGANPALKPLASIGRNRPVQRVAGNVWFGINRSRSLAQHLFLRLLMRRTLPPQTLLKLLLRRQPSLWGG